MLNDRDRLTLSRYIRAIADEVELRDWTIELAENPAPADSQGHIHVTYGRKLATLSVGRGFRELTAAEQRQTIAHELVHCHFEPAANMVLNDLEQWLGKQADQIFFDGFKRQMEYAVDALATALAKRLPPIEWGGEDVPHER